MTIHQDLAICIEDTRRYVSPQAANRLKPWIDYDNDQLVSAIQRSIRIRDNQANGFFIARQDGMSLEQIVLNHPDRFDENDGRIAGLTLGEHRR
jgi:hypothetical protein